MLENLRLKKEYFFYIAFFLYLFCIICETTVLCDNYFGGNYFVLITKMLRYISYFFILLKIFLSNYSFKNLLLIGTVFLILVINSFIIKNKEFIFLFLFIIGCFDIDFKSMIKVNLFIQIIMLLLLVLLSKIGVIDNWFFEEQYRNRQSLGFIYCSHTSVMSMFMTFQYIYLRNKFIKWKEIFLLIFFNLIFFIFTKTNFPLFFSSIAILFAIDFKFNNFFVGFIKKYYKLIIICPILMSVFIISIMYFYDDKNALFIFLNKMTHRRIVLGHNGIMNFGFSIFGEINEIIGPSRYTIYEEYNFIDCSYLKLIFEKGIILFALVIAGYSYSLYKIMKDNDYYLVIVILLSLAHAMIEPSIFDLEFTPFFLCLSYCFNEGDRFNIYENRYKETCKV